MLGALREAYAQAEGRAAPFYGIASALGVAVPLLVGALTAYADEASLAALGAFLVAVAAPEGPYGAQARSLAATVAVVMVGATIGGVLSGHPWATVAFVPLVVALGVAVPWIGPTATLAVLLVAIRPPGSGLFYPGLWELLGGLWGSALLLAPWPAFRLRPLRTALAEAADAVAATLDAVVQDIGAPDARSVRAADITDPEMAAVVAKPDWNQRRRAASEALSAARATYGLYRSPATEPTRPERLIEALSRILNETVTLHGLVVAARRGPARPDWEPAARIATAALAARLRLLAGAVGTAGEMALGSPESRAVRRLTRHSERIGRASRGDPDELVAVALIGQISRTIDRISGTVESARRIVAGDLRLGPALPAWVGRGQWRADASAIREFLRAPRRRLVAALRTRSPRARQAVRVSLAVAAAMAVSAAFNLPHGQWLPLTVLFCMRGSYGQTVTRVMQRIGGTTMGAVLAAVLLALAPGQVGAALLVFGCGLVAYTLRPVNHAYWMLFGTPMIMMLLDFTAPSDWKDAGIRIALTAAGGLFALLTARVLWPTGGAAVLPGQLARLLSTHAELVRATSDVVDEPARRLPQARIAAAERAATAVSDARGRLGHEPVPDTELIARLRAAVEAAQRVRDHLITIAGTSREDPPDSGPAPEILDRVADHLEETADRLEEPAAPAGSRPRPGPAADDLPDLREELAQELHELDDHLSAVTRRRRAEIEAGVAVDDPTPMRHALMQAAGIRHALRALRVDAADLSRTAVESCPASDLSGHPPH